MTIIEIMRPGRWAVLGALALLGVCGTGALADEGYVGSADCAVCHEEVALEFGLTAHAIAPGWDADAGCESCHGPGEAHVDGDLEAIILPTDLPPLEASRICLSCHVEQEPQFTSRHSVHKISDVSCIDCHNPHSAAPKGLEKSGVALCEQCHQSIVSQFSLPRAHPLAGYPHQGKGTDLACAACHNPHTTNPLRLNRGRTTAPCVDCHTEKAGPFVYDHDVALVDGCSSCHQVHGSPNRHLLTQSRQVNLCYQCHPGTQTPGFHSAPAFVNEKCTACHQAIHGSNTNPAFLEE